jgi:hypothetical protein
MKDWDGYEEQERAEMAESAEEEKLEQRWLTGNHAAYRAILLECARNLDEADPLKAAAKLIAERVDTVAALRNLCERYELLDEWREGKDDGLYLADVVRNLEQELAEIIEEDEE